MFSSVDMMRSLITCTGHLYAQYPSWLIRNKTLAHPCLFHMCGLIESYMSGKYGKLNSLKDFL